MIFNIIYTFFALFVLFLILLCIMIFIISRIAKELKRFNFFLSNKFLNKNALILNENNLSQAFKKDINLTDEETEIDAKSESDENVSQKSERITNSQEQDSNQSQQSGQNPINYDIKSKKERVLEAISCKREIEAIDIPDVIMELMRYFPLYANSDYLINVESNDYYRLIDLRENQETRVVVFGDIHSDFFSLSAALLKLSFSEYDYFENAYFVFLGDYLDRGGALFEPLLLLMNLKDILGDRMIMLKGNHESIYFDVVEQSICSHVKPHQSCDCLNEYCSDYDDFLKHFAAFYSTLPVYVYLKTPKKNILLTHASIPKDEYIEMLEFDEMDGSILFKDVVPLSERLNIRNKILENMIWGDPSEYDFKIQTGTRFEFGKKQFERFASQNHIDLFIRSHEEVSSGFKEFFNKKFYTLFSTGGSSNNQSYYSSVEPAIAIIRDDECVFENFYIYRVDSDNKTMVVNIQTKQSYTDIQCAHFILNKEFHIDKSEWIKVRNTIKNIQSQFRNS